MGMDVQHALSGILTRVDDQPEATRPLLHPDLGRQLDDGSQSGRVLCQFREGGVVGTGHDQNVSGCLRVDVSESDRTLVGGENVCADIPGDDGTEEASCAHG